MSSTKYVVKPTAQFRKDYKAAIKRNCDMEHLQRVITKLANGEQLDEKYCDHPLSGQWKGHRECHIEPDWLLIYLIKKDVLVLSLARTGTHSNLFGK